MPDQLRPLAQAEGKGRSLVLPRSFFQGFSETWISMAPTGETCQTLIVDFQALAFHGGDLNNQHHRFMARLCTDFPGPGGDELFWFASLKTTALDQEIRVGNSLSLNEAFAPHADERLFECAPFWMSEGE
jgi:hypothetical protein